jgi:hypothetical protein
VGFVQKAGSASGSGATLTVTVGQDGGVAVPGFATVAAGHTAILGMSAAGGIYAASVTDSHGNAWNVDSPGSPSTTGIRSGLASAPVGTPLAAGDTVTITWSATPTGGAQAGLADFTGIGVSGTHAATDPHGTADHISAATLSLETAAAAGQLGETVISVAGSSSAAGTLSPSATDADSGGTWASLGYPAAPGRLDIAWQAAPATGTPTTFAVTWTDSAGPPQNMDACLVAYLPASGLVIGGTPGEGKAGDTLTFVPDIEGGTGPYTLALASGVLPPGLTLVAGGGGGGGPVGQFGNTYHVPSLGSIQVATEKWVGTAAGYGPPDMVERWPTARKCFFGASDGTGSLANFPQTLGDDTKACVDMNMTAFLVYKPAVNKSLTTYDATVGSATGGNSHGGTQADWIALRDSLKALKAAKVACEAVLWHEIEHQPLTPVQYWSCLAWYSSAVTAALGTGHLHHSSSASYAGKLVSTFPGKPNFSSTCFITGKVWTDCYTHSWLGGYRLDGHDTPGAGAPAATSLYGLAILNGLGLGGVMELGMGQVLHKDKNGKVDQVPGDTPKYVDYLARAALAYPGTSYFWYADPTGATGGTNDVIPGFASDADGSLGGYDARPALRNLADAITGAGGGGSTPEVQGTPTADGSWTVTLRVTDSLGATATASFTFVIGPVTPPPPPPPPPPIPVPVPSPGKPPIPKPWVFKICAQQPSGAELAPIMQAATRQLILRAGAGNYHEATVDLSGDDSAAAYVTELVTDLQVHLGGQVLFCGRIGGAGDSLPSGGDYRFTPAALDYRELLRRRSLAVNGGPNYQGVDVADIAWDLIQQTQNTPAGWLGIARGKGADGLGQKRFINTIRQNFVGATIDQLAQMNPGMFDWDITPYGPGDLRLDMWAPTRGKDQGVTLLYGGPLVDSIDRTTDPSAFANSVFVTGQSTSAQTSIAAGSDTGTIANIDHWGSPAPGELDVDDASSFTASGTLIVHDSAAANALVDYTNHGDNRFTGCTVRGSPSGTVTKGNYVFQKPLDPVQLDAAGIAGRPEGRWDQVIGSQATTQDAVNAAAAYDLQLGEVVTPSYVIVLKPGAWAGPKHIWLGDWVTVIISRGRLNVSDRLQVSEMDFDISPDNIETVTLTLGRPPFKWERHIAIILRRLRNLEAE